MKFHYFQISQKEADKTSDSNIKQWDVTVHWKHQISTNHTWPTPDMEKSY